MVINERKIKKFKKITRNFVLSSTLATVMITSPTFMTTAKAIEPYINNHGNYYLSDDGRYLDIDGTVDYSIINDMDNTNEIYITNATIDASFIFNNKKIKHIIFKDCNFTNANFENNKNTYRYSFIGCKFDNLNFLSNCINITKLNFDSCEIGNVDALNNLYNLEVINFYNVGIENINFLRNKEKLSQLILSNTCVADLSPIANSNIGYLDISNTLSIKNLNPVLTLENLYCFYAKNCEMAYTTEIYNFVRKNRIETNIEKDDLKIKEKVKSIAEKIIDNSMTDNDKIFTIVNYVVDNITYDYNAESDNKLSSEYNQNALQHALNGVGCCRNYSALTMALMQIAGIKVYEIRGNNHIWNLVELEGEYYWIDSTWLDGLDDVEIIKSTNYMNNNPIFPGHPQLTFPVSMYDDVYGKKTNNVDNITETTTLDNDINITEITTLDNDINITETTTLDNNIDKVETTTSTNNIDEITTLNQNYIDNEISTNEEITTQEIIDKKTSEKIIKHLRFKQASIGGVVGIAVALGFAIKAKNKKKNINKSKAR